MTVEILGTPVQAAGDVDLREVERTGSTRTGMDLPHLRRLQWAVRAILTLGVAASVCANVLHARDELIAQAIAAWPPFALLLTVELVSRVPVHRRSLAAVRITATAAISGIAAYVSYWHMAAVAARYGEDGVAPYLLPLSVDGLIVVASVSLVELAGRVRTSRAESTRATNTTSTQAVDALTDTPVSTGKVDESGQTLGTQADYPSEQDDDDKSAVGADLVMLLPAARAARETLRRQGRSLSRDALAAQLRADGHTIATGRVSALLNVLRTDPLTSRANGSRTDTH